MYTQRGQGSRADGGSWDDAMKLAVWRRGLGVPGYDPDVWRRDACGAMMYFDDYGVVTAYGWEIDHIFPVSKGGRDELCNLQPLHWKNNRRKGDDWPNWWCAV